jgi:hypothetical protein
MLVAVSGAGTDSSDANTALFPGGVHFGDMMGASMDVLGNWDRIKQLPRKTDADVIQNKGFAPLGLVGVSTHGAVKNNKFVDGKHANEARAFTAVKCIISEDWGLNIALGSQIMLIQYLVRVYNLAFKENPYNKEWLSAKATSVLPEGLGALQIATVLSEITDLTGIKHSSALFRAGKMECNAGSNRELPSTDSIQVTSVANKRFVSESGNPNVWRLQLHPRPVTREDLEAIPKVDHTKFHYETACDGVPVTRIPTRIAANHASHALVLSCFSSFPCSNALMLLIFPRSSALTLPMLPTL